MKRTLKPRSSRRRPQFASATGGPVVSGPVVLPGGERDYFREPVQTPQLNGQVQPSITPERVTQSVRMRFNPLRGLTPERVVTNLEQWRLGFFRNAGLMFDVMEKRDYQIQIVAPKRKKAVARHGYDVVKVAEIPAGQETLADQQQEFLKNFWDHVSVQTAIDPDEEGGFGLLVRQMLDAIGKHYAVHEIVWQVGTETTRPQDDETTDAGPGGPVVSGPVVSTLTAKFIFCPIWWFEGTRGKLRFLDSEFQIYGRDMLPGEWLVTVHDGIMEACSLLFLFKWNALKAWLIFLDKFGQPGVQGLTDAQKGSKEWEDFKEAVAEFSEEYATVTNRSCEIKLIEASQKGGTDGLFDTLVALMDKAVTQLWRGGDLGTTGGKDTTGASLQQSETEVLETDDGKIVEETLTLKVSRFALDWKFGAGTPQLAYLKLRTSPKKATDSDLKVDEFLLTHECPLDKSEVYERYGRSEPKEGDEVIEPSEPQPAGFGSPSPGGEGRGEGERANQFANAEEIGATLHDTIFPILKRLEAIAQIDDAAIQQHMLEKLLRDFPQIARAIQADDSLARKLSPRLEAALLAGLKTTT